jgi:hypothetical protein
MEQAGYSTAGRPVCLLHERPKDNWETEIYKYRNTQSYRIYFGALQVYYINCIRAMLICNWS